MKSFRAVFVGVSLMVALSGCDRIKNKLSGAQDASADATVDAATAETTPDATTPPATPGAAAVTAANEDDVARFPDETKLDNVAATIQRVFSAREAPPAGTVVASLAKGQAVSEIASRSGGKYFLITWDDAKSGKKLMGWVHADAFSAAPAADAGVVAPTCPAGETALFSDTPFCGKVCAKDGDCPSGQACKGSAAKWKQGKAGDAVSVCTVFHARDAGAPTSDAGGPLASADGGLKLPPISLDGGARLSDVVDPTSGQCPASYVLVKKDGKCHKLCPRAVDCHMGAFCGVCEGNRICSLTRTFCE